MESPTPTETSRRLFGLDAYAPTEIVERIQTQGIENAHLSALTKIMLGMVGGGLIGLGAMGQTLMVADPALGDGLGRILGGVAFAMGYLAAFTAGAAVFTTNVLLVMTWAARQIPGRLLLRNWGLVLLANAIGGGGLAFMVVASGQPMMHDGAIAEQIAATATSKAGETLIQAFFKGMIGNVLICIGAWIAMAGRSVTDKMIGPLLPIALLPIADFEHAVGNLYYFQVAGYMSLFQPSWAGAEGLDIAPLHILRNMVAVIAGNIVGGGLLVGLVYYVVYRRSALNGGASER